MQWRAFLLDPIPKFYLMTLGLFLVWYIVSHRQAIFMGVSLFRYGGAQQWRNCINSCRLIYFSEVPLGPSVNSLILSWAAKKIAMVFWWRRWGRRTLAQKRIFKYQLHCWSHIKARTDLQLPLQQWGASNVYLSVLSSWKVNIAENPIAVMGLYIRMYLCSI
jgi:hypothetical protein